MQISEILRSVPEFVEKLLATKKTMPDVAWYPYDSTTNIPFFQKAFAGRDISVNRVVDIGPADGDIAFLFSHFGCDVTAIEHPTINYNKGRAIKRMNEALGNKVHLEFGDVDFGFKLDGQFDLGVATGIAYHLRNPALLYITLAQHCQYLITNTKVMDVFKGRDVSEESIAYFAERRELNNDPTNWWVFTPLSYKRLLKRTGWKVLTTFHAGADTGDLEKRNKRFWALCERLPNYAQLTIHHDF